MMLRNSRDKVPQAKQEACIGGVGRATGVPPPSSRPWTGLRDSRIVRVARSLGGKDRHSKVSTVRGLRDRRVRLSVPTAIQLYDLQDRLGLNQPSKVVDWLLDAAQHEIDKLPPLQFPPGSFLHCPQAMTEASHGGVLPFSDQEPPSGSPPQMVANMEYRAKCREPTSGSMEEKDGFFRRIQLEQQFSETHSSMVIPVHGDPHGQSQSSMPSMGGSSNSSSEYAFCYHMEATNLCSPHVGCQQLSQGEELHGHRQVPAAAPHPMLSTYAAPAGYDHKQANNLQMGLHGFMLGFPPSSLTSPCTSMRPLQVSISSKHHPNSHNGHDSTAE